MRTLLIIAFLTSSLSFNAQLLLNELSASSSTIVLADDNNKSSHWIEIYNPTTGPINASGFYITNNLNYPLKWHLPNVNIPSGGFIKVFCSGEDRVTGQFYHSNFKLNRTGGNIYIFSSSSVLSDSKLYGNLDLNHSYGRSPDGGSWYFFNTPTPGSSNNSSTAYAAYANSVTVTPATGFYTSAQTVSMSDPGFQIRYTTDGTEPTVSSNLYSSPISINANTPLKVKAFAASGPILPTQTKHIDYFIGESGLGNLPVISITMDPNDFSTVYNAPWIYPGNTPMPEAKAHMEYYSPAKILKFELDFDLKLHGKSSINVCLQKSFEVGCKKYYNSPKVNYPLFRKKPFITKSDGFVLRSDNGGKSTNDGIMERLLNGTNNPGQRTYIDNQAYEPCVVFVNGNYWGEYQIREKSNADWVHNNYNIDADSVDLIEQKMASNPGYCINAFTQADYGSDTGFVNLRNYMVANNPTTTAFYNHVDANLDIKNYTDYFATQTYWGNWDWINSQHLNNIKMWRKQGGGQYSKWRYFMYDLDYMEYNGPTYPCLQTVLNTCANLQSDVFISFLQNPQFKNYFINRYADLMNTVFQPQSVDTACYKWRDSLDAAMPRHFQKWPVWIGTYAAWYPVAASISNFNVQRLTEVRNQIQGIFNYQAQVTPTFEVYPPEAGYVHLNTITPAKYPWNGVYYNGEPITITAVAANSGYTFSHWESTDLGNNNTNITNTFNLNSSQTIKLFFVTGMATPPITTGIKEFDNTTGCNVMPNPASKQLRITLANKSVNSISVVMYDVRGAEVSAEQNFELMNESFDVSALIEDKPQGIYFLSVKTKEGTYNRKIIVSRGGN